MLLPRVVNCRWRSALVNSNVGRLIEDRKLFEKAAKASEHKTLSAWIRFTLKEAAR
jgi:hypothetical protein